MPCCAARSYAVLTKSATMLKAPKDPNITVMDSKTKPRMSETICMYVERSEQSALSNHDDELIDTHCSENNYLLVDSIS